MRCPECGSEGSMDCFVDELHGGYEVTHFFCDENPEHHFLIYKLEPYVTQTLEEYVSSRDIWDNSSNQTVKEEN